jgi:16S rRNA (guanine527-N7)-methyltransferase
VTADDPGLEAAVARRGADCGLVLSPDQCAAIAAHARAVLDANARLKLTTVVDGPRFLERHVGESLEGAAMLPAEVRGRLLDLGSGNGYPGLVVAAARPGLTPLLAEASTRKAAFLRDALALSIRRGEVLERQVQRPADLDDGTAVRVLTARALGNWERLLPRLRDSLEPEGELLLWAGAEAETILARDAWRKLEAVERRPLPGREASWIWRLRRI